MQDVILNPVVSRRHKPYAHVDLTLVGSDTVRIVAGHNLAVPNIWSLHTWWATLTCDATPANRYVKIFQVIDGVNANFFTSQAVIASTTKTFAGSPESAFSNMTRLSADGYMTMDDKTFLIAGDDSIYFDVVSGVAGDSVRLYMLLLWRNWDFGILSPKPNRNRKE